MEEKKLVPKLRFPGFTEPWEQRKLGECIDSFEYGLNAAAMEYDGKHKYIRITDIDDETHAFIQDNLTSPAVDFNGSTSNYRLKMGDIVFARTGASVGKTYLYNPNDGELYYAGFLIKGAVNEDCDAGFIYQNTLIKEYDSFIKITSQRSGQPGVNSKEYASFKLNIPSKCEQEKISSLLSVLDNLVTLHQRKLEHLKLKKKSLLQKLFPKEGEVYPELRFPGFTDPWEQRKLGELYKPRREKNDGRFGKDKIISVANMYFKNDVKLATYEYLLTYNVFLLGDIAFEGHCNNSFSYGRFVENSIGDGIVSHVFDVLMPNTKCCINYWKVFINYEPIMGKILRRCTNSSRMMANLELKAFLKETINIPTIKEQQKIGNFLEQFDQYITLHQRKLEHLQLLKKALLQQLFV